MRWTGEIRTMNYTDTILILIILGLSGTVFAQLIRRTSGFLLNVLGSFLAFPSFQEAGRLVPPPLQGGPGG